MVEWKHEPVPGEPGVHETVVLPGKEGALFLSRLSWTELQRLRDCVRRVHMRHWPAGFCTDRECDRIIETLGPQVAEQMIRRLVDGKSLHPKYL